MAESKINAFTPLSIFNSLAGTKVYLPIDSKAGFETYLFGGGHTKESMVFAVGNMFDPFPSNYGSGIILPCLDTTYRNILYYANNELYICSAHKANGIVTYSWKKVTATSI